MRRCVGWRSVPMTLHTLCRETLSPRLLQEWHPSKNLPHSPETISWESCIEAWWRCTACERVFNQRVRERVEAPHIGCDTCAVTLLLVDTHPSLAAEWDTKTNAIDRAIRLVHVRCDDPRPVSWQCHVCRDTWKESPASRVANPKGCPTCRAMIPKSQQQWSPDAGALPIGNGDKPLFCEHPEMRSELDSRRLIRMSREDAITVNSRERLRWQCVRCRRSYDATPFEKVHGQGCPKCRWIATVYAKEFPTTDWKKHWYVKDNRVPKYANPSYFSKKVPRWNDTTWN